MNQTNDIKTRNCRLAKWSFGLAMVNLAIFTVVAVLMAGPPLPKYLQGVYRVISILALVFIFNCPVALVLGIISIFEIRKSRLKGLRCAIGTVIISGVLIIGIVASVFLIVRPIIRRITCGMNLEGLGKALQIYSWDFDNKYPTPNKWCDLLIEYAEVTPKSFVCPSARDGRSAYAINSSCEPNSPPDVVLVFETKGGWNQFGGPELLVSKRHKGNGSCILFNDTYVRFVGKKQVSQLKWKLQVSDPTPDVHHLVWVKDLDRIQSILAENPELVHSKNIFGRTPLHTAVLIGNKDIVELLIAKGANVNARDNMDETPLTYAFDRGHTELADLLRKHGGVK
jgi:hypothetical protein